MVAGLKGYVGNLDYPMCILAHELRPFALGTRAHHYIMRLHYVHPHVITLSVCITYTCTSFCYAIALRTCAMVAGLKGYGRSLDCPTCILTHELHPFALRTRAHRYVMHLHYVHSQVITLRACITYTCTSLHYVFELRTCAMVARLRL
jgi:hypothetical protein